MLSQESCQVKLSPFRPQIPEAIRQDFCSTSNSAIKLVSLSNTTVRGLSVFPSDHCLKRYTWLAVAEIVTSQLVSVSTTADPILASLEDTLIV